MPESDNGNTGTSGGPAQEWTDEEMESAEPMPLPEISEDDDEAGESTNGLDGQDSDKR